MALSERMEKALNEQMNAEMYSSYLYLSMGAYFESRDLPGFATWMGSQAQEELLHGMKFFDYVNSKGGRVRLSEIEKPQIEWDSPVDVFENVYAHEQKVTSLINDLVSMALEEDDYATNNFLQWFVAEQVEEEENASSVLAKMKKAKGDQRALLMLDKEMSNRPMKLVEATKKE